MNVSIAKRYRMYIDESGNHHYASETPTSKYDPNQYLGLIGIIENQHTTDFIQPQFNTIKDVFKDPDYPDRPIVLHYNDVVLKTGVFEILDNSQIKNQFNAS